MNAIQKLRIEHLFTLEEMAKKLGTTRQTVSNLEKKATPKMVKKCSKIFNENVFKLFGSDVLKILPKTEEDKKILIEIIQNL